MGSAGEIMTGRGWSWILAAKLWLVVGWSWVGGGKIMSGREWSHNFLMPVFILFFILFEKRRHSIFFLTDSNQLDKVVCARKNFAFKICTPSNDCSNYILQILVVRWQFQEPIYLNEDKNIVEKNSRMHPS